eukprot:2643416-Rhodomonas_salina.1
MMVVSLGQAEVVGMIISPAGSRVVLSLARDLQSFTHAGAHDDCMLTRNKGSDNTLGMHPSTVQVYWTVFHVGLRRGRESAFASQQPATGSETYNSTSTQHHSVEIPEGGSAVLTEDGTILA